MKISIIGVARSRTQVLLQLLSNKYPNIPCLYEIYTYKLKESIPLSDITHHLFLSENFIVKILGRNIVNQDPIDQNIDILRLNEYDSINLIERPDFFNQCCSLQVCKDSNVWHHYKKNSHMYSYLNHKRFTLSLDTVLVLGKDIESYMNIKTYMTSNNISHQIHDYSKFDDTPPKITVMKGKLDYTKIINNYHLGESITNIFDKHYNYNTCYHDYPSFEQDIIKLFNNN